MKSRETKNPDDVKLQTRKRKKKLLKKKKASPSLLELPNLGADCEINHTGPIHIKGDIGNNAKLTVTNGSVRVDGNIHDHVVINVIDSDRDPTIGEFEVNRVPLKFQILKKFIDVKGSVGNQFKLNGANTRTDLTIMGKLGHESQVVIGGGNISVVEVGHDCHLQTGQGDITSFLVASGSKLIVDKKGMVEALRIQNHVTFQVPAGSIYLQRIGFMKHTTMFYDKKSTHVSLGGVDLDEQIDKNAKALHIQPGV